MWSNCIKHNIYHTINPRRQWCTLLLLCIWSNAGGSINNGGGNDGDGVSGGDDCTCGGCRCRTKNCKVSLVSDDSAKSSSDSCWNSLCIVPGIIERKNISTQIV